jgi:CCR4-NOT transcription complex subunit 1
MEVPFPDPVPPSHLSLNNYQAIDAFSKLVTIMIKYSDSPNNRVALLSRVMSVVVRELMKDYDEKKMKFNQKPYFRFFSNCLIDLNSPDPILEPINLQILLAFR